MELVTMIPPMPQYMYRKYIHEAGAVNYESIQKPGNGIRSMQSSNSHQLAQERFRSQPLLSGWLEPQSAKTPAV